MDLVSIIVPVYNSERYLEKCIASIINQSYKNIEIILIDDGSTDRSKKIIEKWKDKDKRIKTIFQKNNGISYSRNKGIDIATGKYVCFFDSDDWIEKEMIFEMYEQISKCNAQLVYCNFYYEYTINSKIGIKSENNKDIYEYNWRNHEIYNHYLSPYSCTGLIANKMFSLEIIQKNNLKFVDSNLVGGEDSLFNLCYFASVKKSVFLDKVFYHYIQRENSQIHLKNSQIIYKHINLIREFSMFLENKNYNNLIVIIPHLFYHYYTLGIETALRNKDRDKSIIENIKKAKSNRIFNELIIKLLKAQLNRSTSIGSKSRRLRTILFGILSFINADYFILKISKAWLKYKNKNFMNKYGLYSNIKTTKSPLISIVLPLYNCEKYILETIKSIKKQTYTNWELIIIDDYSNDKSFEIVKKFEDRDDKVKIYRNKKNMGVCFSRNRGIELSQGEWIAFIDSDDIWDAQKLELQMEKIEGTNGEFLFTNTFIKKENGRVFRHCFDIPEIVYYEDLKKKNVIPLSSVLLKKSIIKEFIFEKDNLHEDYIMWLKILKDNEAAYGINKPLTTIRMRKESRSSKKIGSLYKTYKLYRYLGIGVLESLINTYTNGLRALKKYICVKPIPETYFN